mgnify:FL=1
MALSFDNLVLLDRRIESIKRALKEKKFPSFMQEKLWASLTYLEQIRINSLYEEVRASTEARAKTVN